MRKMPECPICGEECNVFYTSIYGREIVGCDRCINEESAEERAAEDQYDEAIDHAYDMARG